MQFIDLFQKATGQSPFPYQQTLAERKDLPRVITAPTGAGKTAAVVLGWLWRRRFHPDKTVHVHTPRRLVYCLPMRVLVEQTVTVAHQWLQSLGLQANNVEETNPISVWQLMGGEVEMDWDQFPEADTIIIGTQDQLLSRALNRGYAMSRYRWPMHFGLLNSDCLWVMDEVQLMGPGLATTAQLQAFRDQFGTCGPTKSIWMSATLRYGSLATIDAPAANEYKVQAVKLEAADMNHPLLSLRIKATKPVQKLDLTVAKASKNSYAKALAEHIARKHQQKSLTLVVVNQVQRAQELRQELDQLNDTHEAELVLVHSRFRPAERYQINKCLSSELPENGRIVVATQAIEAGVDISARTLFTELAPWASLVQRFGRCNRKGEWQSPDGAMIYWLDIETDNKQSTESAPYDAEHLDKARELLEELSDASIDNLQNIEDPTPEPVGQVIRRRDLLDLFDTTPDLAGEDIDVSPFIRDADQLDVAVAWRDFSQKTVSTQAPVPDELCPVSLYRFRDFVNKKLKSKSVVLPQWWDGLDGRWKDLDLDTLRPGMIILLHTTFGGYDQYIGWWPEAQTAPAVALSEQSAVADGYDDDHLTSVRCFVPLAKHLDDVSNELASIVNLAGDGEEAAALQEAARYHDIGKAHPWFQNKLLHGLEATDPHTTQGPWAKSEKYHHTHNEEVDKRPHFRHELASALAMLQDHKSDLAAYIVASHHGKVRLSIRSLPGEKAPENGGRFARGVWEGDVIPQIKLTDGTSFPETVLSLQIMEMGRSDEGLSWLERTLRLRKDHGPFRLAFFEALLRIADWRASAKESDENA